MPLTMLVKRDTEYRPIRNAKILKYRDISPPPTLANP